MRLHERGRVGLGVGPSHEERPDIGGAGRGEHGVVLAEVVPRVRIARQRAKRLVHEGVRGHRGHQRVGQADVGRVRQQQPLPRLMVERKGGNSSPLGRPEARRLLKPPQATRLLRLRPGVKSSELSLGSPQPGGRGAVLV